MIESVEQFPAVYEIRLKLFTFFNKLRTRVFKYVHRINLNVPYERKH